MVGEKLVDCFCFNRRSFHLSGKRQQAHSVVGRLVNTNGRSQADAGKSAVTVKRIDWHLPSHLKGTLAGARPPYYLHRLSTWMWRSGMALALFLAVAGLGFVVAQASQGRMTVAEWVLGLLVLPFIVLLARPITWRSPVAMVADVQGLYFIGGSGEQEHIFVPWQDIGALSIERHASANGVIRTVVIGIKGQTSFWDSAVTSRFMSGLLVKAWRRARYLRRMPLEPSTVKTDQCPTTVC